MSAFGLVAADQAIRNAYANPPASVRCPFQNEKNHRHADCGTCKALAVLAALCGSVDVVALDAERSAAETAAGQEANASLDDLGALSAPEGWRVLVVYDGDGELVSREVVPADHKIPNDGDDYPLLADEVWPSRREALAALLQNAHP